MDRIKSALIFTVLLLFQQTYAQTVKCYTTKLTHSGGFCKGKTLNFKLCSTSEQQADKKAQDYAATGNGRDNWIINVTNGRMSFDGDCGKAVQGLCNAVGGTVKTDACSPDAICRVATPIGSVGTYSQCMTDADCNKTLYPTSEAGEDASRPPRKFCCSDMVQLASAHCSNVNATIVNTKWKDLRWGDMALPPQGYECSTDQATCISQFVNGTPPAFLPCYFGSNSTGSTLAVSSQFMPPQLFCLSGSLRCGLDCANPQSEGARRACDIFNSVASLGLGQPCSASDSQAGNFVKVYWASSETCSVGFQPSPPYPGAIANLSCCNTPECNRPGAQAPGIGCYWGSNGTGATLALSPPNAPQYQYCMSGLVNCRLNCSDTSNPAVQPLCPLMNAQVALGLGQPCSAADIAAGSWVRVYWAEYNPDTCAVARGASPFPAFANGITCCSDATRCNKLSIPTTSTVASTTTVAPSTTTAPITTPAPVVSTFQVKLALTLASLTPDTFTPALQLSFKQAMARAAGLTATDWPRVQLEYGSTARRRLLTGLAVNVTINMRDAASASSAVTGLTADNINAKLQEANLPTAVITSPPKAVTPPTSLAAGPPLLSSIAATAAIAVVLGMLTTFEN